MNVWIFQAVPERYDLLGKLEKLDKEPNETWYATRFYTRMNPGDLVFFWLGGVPREKRGVYGWGKLTSSATLKDNWDAHGVNVAYKRKFPNPVTIPHIEKIPILSSMLILRMAVGTNFLLSEDEAKSLISLCSKADPKGPEIPLFKGGVDNE